MTRSEALAPLKAGEGRFKGHAGALTRGQVRRAALAYNVDYYENKGFLESNFVFRGLATDIKCLIEWFKHNMTEDE